MAARQSTKPALLLATVLSSSATSIRTERNEPLVHDVEIQRAVRIISSPESSVGNDRHLVDRYSDQLGLRELMQQAEVKEQILSVSSQLARDPRVQSALFDTDIIQRVLSNNQEQFSPRLIEEIYESSNLEDENRKLEYEAIDNQTKNPSPPQILYHKENEDEQKVLEVEEDEDELYSWECAICLGIPFRIHAIDCKNGHSFCGECIQKVYARNPLCPLCNNLFTTMNYVRIMDEMIRTKVSKLEKKYSRHPKFFEKQMAMQSFLQRYNEPKIDNDKLSDANYNDNASISTSENVKEDDADEKYDYQNTTNQNNENGSNINQSSQNTNHSSNTKSSWTQGLTFTAIVGAVLILVIAIIKR